MKIAVWWNDKGPAMAFTIPPGKKKVQPSSAHVPGGESPRPWRDLEAKGFAVTWEDWIRQLTHKSPYFGQWTVEEVPDDVLGIQGALDHVVSRTSKQALS
jgi:hypothetical protein